MLTKGLLALVVGCACSAALAQSWPARPVTILVGTSPGGPIDTLVRLVASNMQRKYQQSFVVENRLGGGGLIAAGALARAQPDGYTFASGFSLLSDIFVKDMPFKTGEVVPLALAGQAPYALIVSPSAKSRTLAEFLAFAKSNPGGVNFGIVPGGTHETETLDAINALGIQAGTIGYKGIAPIYTALVANEVHAVMGSGSPLVAAGRIFALAQGGDRRSTGLPDTPTFRELGQAYNPVSYYAFYARAGTPRDIMERFAADTGEAVKTPEFAEKLGKAFNITPLGLGPDESSRLLGEEDQRMRRVAARAGIKPQ